MTDQELAGASRRLLRELSATLLQGAQQVAREGDTWFLATVRGLDKGGKLTKGALGKLFHHVFEGSRKLRPRFLKDQSQRARIHRMLMNEARRSTAQLSRREFKQFSQRIAFVLELVLSGSVSIADIAFEQDERARPLDHPS